MPGPFISLGFLTSQDPIPLTTLIEDHTPSAQSSNDQAFKDLKAFQLLSGISFTPTLTVIG
jgi:hypothetical protein